MFSANPIIGHASMSYAIVERVTFAPSFAPCLLTGTELCLNGRSSFLRQARPLTGHSASVPVLDTDPARYQASGNLARLLL